MHESVLIEIANHVIPSDFIGKSIVEFGSRNVNGGLRRFIERFHPASYLGLDYIYGEGVDRCFDLEKDDLPCQFDVVISTETIEHVQNWRRFLNLVKSSCKPGGLLILTGRGPGMPYHGYPFDFWRFDSVMISKAFWDCNILHLIDDWQVPGFILIAKRTDLREMDYSDVVPLPAPSPPNIITRWRSRFIGVMNVMVGI